MLGHKNANNIATESKLIGLYLRERIVRKGHVVSYNCNIAYYTQTLIGTFSFKLVNIHAKLREEC